MANPNCPEPNCKRLLRVKHLKTNLGTQPCPKCGSSEFKRYILTSAKEGKVKCTRCKEDYMPKRREGLDRFWICKNHPWQKFKVGAGVIMCKTKSKTDREVKDMLKPMQFQQTKQRQQPNVQRR